MSRALLTRPTQIVIDDVGWRQGTDGHASGQPFRTGLGRLHEPADYLAIAQLGRALHVRPVAAMTLGEWDPDDRLARIPTASWMGRGWTNPAAPTDWAWDCAAVLRDQADFIEPAFHGLGHEFWIDGQMQRAEFCDTAGQPRSAEEITARFEMFLELFDHYNLGPHPRWFVPTAFLHRHEPDRPDNLAELARPFGIEVISTPFHRCHFIQPSDTPRMGFDHGLAVVDRGRDPLQWNHIAPRPEDIALPDQPIIGMHWVNILADDPADNDQALAAWLAPLCAVDNQFGTMLSPDSATFLSQLIHQTFTAVTVMGPAVTLDFTAHRPASRALLGPSSPAWLDILPDDAPLEISAVGGIVRVESVDARDGFSRVALRCELSET